MAGSSQGTFPRLVRVNVGIVGISYCLFAALGNSASYAWGENPALPFLEAVQHCINRLERLSL